MLETSRIETETNQCELPQKEVKYLGHVVSPAGIATNPGKVHVVAIKDWPIPIGLNYLQAFLGTVGYC